MCNWSRKFKFSRNDSFCKITFAYKVRNDVHVFAFHHVQDLAQTWFFLPERAVHFRKSVTSNDLVGMLKGWGARIWIQSRTVAYKDQSAALFVDHLLIFDGSENSSMRFHL